MFVLLKLDCYAVDAHSHLNTRRRSVAFADFPSLYNGLLEVITPDGIQASNWDLFEGAVFGRDSLQVALDLVAFPQFNSLAEQVMFSLARLQGVDDDPLTEEEPGRIHHEYRSSFVGGREVRPRVLELMQQLNAERHIGAADEHLYYGTVDATPLFVRLAGEYCSLYGREILDTRFRHLSGHILTLREAVQQATNW